MEKRKSWVDRIERKIRLIEESVLLDDKRD